MSAAVPTRQTTGQSLNISKKMGTMDCAVERRPSRTNNMCHILRSFPNFYAWRMVVAAPRRERRQGARRIAKAFKPIVVVFAALYFLVDAIFFSLIRPLGTWLSKLPIFRWIGGGFDPSVHIPHWRCSPFR